MIDKEMTYSETVTANLVGNLTGNVLTALQP